MCVCVYICLNVFTGFMCLVMVCLCVTVSVGVQVCFTCVLGVLVCVPGFAFPRKQASDTHCAHTIGALYLYVFCVFERGAV